MIEMKYIIWALRWRTASVLMRLSFFAMPECRAKRDYVKAVYDVKYKIIALTVD